ncbi:MAG: ATP synthase F0 subunit B [Myxococcota bacterium]|nr:ATP synthase F0 subunit B [Myxococcota bacterium]
MRSILTALLFVLVAAPAFAAGGGDDHGPAEFPIWEIVNFVLLAAVLVYVGRKPMQEMFASRREEIAGDIDRASALLEEAESRNAEWQKRLADLDAELESIRVTARQRAEEEGERILAEAADGAERIRRDAVAAVEHELRRAQEQLREEAANLSTELATGILDREVGDSDRDRLMDEFISRVDSSGGSGGNA